MANFVWTEEARALLAKLWDEGYSASQIARQVTAVFKHPISRNAVVSRAHGSGLKRRASPIVRLQNGKVVNVAAMLAGQKTTLPPLLSAEPDAAKPVPPKPAPQKPVAAPAKKAVAADDAPKPPPRYAGPVRQCQWLDGDGPWVQCKEHAVFARPYCVEHVKRAFIPVRDRNAA